MIYLRQIPFYSWDVTWRIANRQIGAMVAIYLSLLREHVRNGWEHKRRLDIRPSGPKGTSVTTNTPDTKTNHLLAALPAGELARLNPFMTVHALEVGQVLIESGSAVEYVYFPCSGMVSLVAVMAGGKAVETATVGREGAVGLMAGLGVHIMMTRAEAQVPLIAFRIPASRFRLEALSSVAIRDLIVRYHDALLGQVQITAACNALHPVRMRLVRWILQARDCIDGDKIPLTQELLSAMLGVRRSSVSEAAQELQETGLIRYRRGVIEVLDQPRLERASCECRGLMLARTALVMGRPVANGTV